ncbi:MAG: N-6 DNA methylase [Nocardioidaceae bacterium]|nr:N-6 DNA methylase [Nocardioidaceae bacterium]MCL2611626.1 N-6 DNA methylase [Nocardioidaceae bacterium]
MEVDARRRAEEAAADYERGLAADPGRRSRGSFYTPPDLVAWILDRALAPTTRRVLDPACGTGHFLVAAAERVGARAVWGSDLDGAAVAVARDRLRALDPSLTEAELADRVRHSDGLACWAGERFEAVVGNPPFLGQLRRRTAGATGGLGAYTDTSAAFLHASLGLVGDGGAVALVQPLSVLAARDAGPARAEVARRGAVVDFWCSPRPVFDGTDVLTCVPLVSVGRAGGPAPDDWGALAAPTFGIPAVSLPSDAGVVGDLAACTADFRDQYYGLVPHVRDAADGLRPGEVRLVTTGLIEPARSQWGEVPTRFARRRYAAPAVAVADLDPPLAAWARSRLVAKLLVAGQGRVIEAVADPAGELLPSVPVVSVVPHDPGDLWRLLAVTLAPPVVAYAAARYLGTGLTPGSVKVSARQLAALPLPRDHERWAAAATLAREGARPARVAELMTAAYAAEDPALTAWWAERARIRNDTVGARD